MRSSMMFSIHILLSFIGLIHILQSTPKEVQGFVNVSSSLSIKDTNTRTQILNSSLSAIINSNNSDIWINRDSFDNRLFKHPSQNASIQSASTQSHLRLQSQVYNDRHKLNSSRSKNSIHFSSRTNIVQLSKLIIVIRRMLSPPCIISEAKLLHSSSIFLPVITYIARFNLFHKIRLLFVSEMIQSTFSTFFKRLQLYMNFPNVMTRIKLSIQQSSTTRLYIISFIFFLTLLNMYDWIRISNRQSQDATSEWSRYAKHPLLRGRDFSILSFRILPLMILAKLIEQIPSTITSTNNNTSNLSLWKTNQINRLNSKSGKILANGLLRLGPLYIKLGQILSCRENLFPKEWAKSLERLQDQVPAKSGKEALELAYAAFDDDNYGTTTTTTTTTDNDYDDKDNTRKGFLNLNNGGINSRISRGKSRFEALFCDFDDVPIAAASLGQVHIATLRPKVNQGLSTTSNSSNSNSSYKSTHSNDHRNTNKNASQKVAIKLQRPYLREIYDKDLKLMKSIAKFVDSFTEKTSKRSGPSFKVGGVQQSWQSIFADAELILYREIDYKSEAENAQRFCQDFGLGLNGVPIPCTKTTLDGKQVIPSAASWLRSPYVYTDLSTEKALVMEYVPSIKISNDAELTKAGVTAEDKEYLAECLARAYLRQFCVNKFFSTDPHPGNLGVEIVSSDDGSKPSVRLVFYDFGQACQLSDDQGEGILAEIEAIIDMNVDNCILAFKRMGVLVDGADMVKLRSVISNNFETGKIKVKRRKNKMMIQRTKKSSTTNSSSSSTNVENVNLSSSSSSTLLNEASSVPLEVSTTDLKAAIDTTGGVNNKAAATAESEILPYFTLPAEYAFVARAISQMDGVGKNLMMTTTKTRKTLQDEEDDTFDFISAAAPYLVEIKGGEKYLSDEAKKFFNNVSKRGLEWEKSIFRMVGFDFQRYKNRKRM